MSTKAEEQAARDLLKPPPAKDLEAVRARRLEVKDILNGNLLSPEARKGYEELYEQTGAILEQAAQAASSK